MFYSCGVLPARHAQPGTGYRPAAAEYAGDQRKGNLKSHHDSKAKFTDSPMRSHGVCEGDKSLSDRPALTAVCGVGGNR